MFEKTFTWMTPITITHPQKSKMPRMLSGKVAIRENCAQIREAEWHQWTSHLFVQTVWLIRCHLAAAVTQTHCVREKGYQHHAGLEQKAEVHIREKETCSQCRFQSLDFLSAGKGNFSRLLLSYWVQILIYLSKKSVPNMHWLMQHILYVWVHLQVSEIQP